MVQAVVALALAAGVTQVAGIDVEGLPVEALVAALVVVVSAAQNAHEAARKRWLSPRVPVATIPLPPPAPGTRIDGDGDGWTEAELADLVARAVETVAPRIADAVVTTMTQSVLNAAGAGVRPRLRPVPTITLPTLPTITSPKEH